MRVGFGGFGFGLARGGGLGLGQVRVVLGGDHGELDLLEEIARDEAGQVAVLGPDGVLKDTLDARNMLKACMSPNAKLSSLSASPASGKVWAM